MTTQNNNSGKRGFRNRQIGIPFGRFENAPEDDFPCNESMIGREGARAKLINFLNTAGASGSVLITGRRGSGKSRFVEYCLREYEAGRVEKYWNSDMARGFRSLVWLSTTAFIFAASFVLGNKFIEVLYLDAPEEPILWIPLLLFIAVLCSPIVYAWQILNGVCAMLYKDKTPGVWSVIGVSAIIWLLIWPQFWTKYTPKLLPLFGSPAGWMSMFLCVLAIVSYASSAISCQSIITNMRPYCESLTRLADKALNYALIKRTQDSLIKYYTIAVLIATSAAVFIIYSYDTDKLPDKQSDLFATLRIYENILFSAILFAGMCFFYSRAKSKETSKSSTQNKTETPHTKAIKKAARLNSFAAFTVVYVVALIFTFAVTNLFGESQMYYASYPLILLPTIWLVYHVINRLVFSTELQAYILLIMKAIFCIALSLHALHPVLSPLLSKTVEKAITDPVCKWNPPAKPQDDNVYNFIMTYDRPYCNTNEDITQTSISSSNNLACKDSDKYRDSCPPYYSSLFIQPISEWSYIFIVVLITSFFHWLEYEKIIKPAQWQRRDIALRLRNKRPDEFNDGWGSCATSDPIYNEYSIRQNAEARENVRALEKLTLLWMLCDYHMHSIISTINLGFEQLDHRGVVHAMLLSIREQYRKKFTDLRIPRVLLRSFFILLFSMIFVSNLAKGSFSGQPTGGDKTSKKTPTPYYALNPKQLTVPKDKYCPTNTDLPRIPLLLCEAFEKKAPTILAIAYQEVVTAPLPLGLDDNDILSYLFDFHSPYYQKTNAAIATKGISLRVYHLGLFFLVFTSFRRINRKFSIIPYARTIEKIDDLLDALTAKTTSKKSRELPGPIQWLKSLYGYQKELSVERDYLDSRVVELLFMDVLYDITYSRSLYASLFHGEFTTPAVEVTFVFDELDKLAMDSGEQKNKGDSYSNDNEISRLSLMKKLLSEMKRLIVSSSARFIFLGGRLLHDDWLADGARRQPLLTSIFSDEIYLPSLLEDSSIAWFSGHASAKPYAIHRRIEEYFLLQYHLANLRYQTWVTRHWIPLIGVYGHKPHQRGFVQTHFEGVKPFGAICECQTGKELPPGASLQLYKAFVAFLAYRSAGNPKRLNEILSSFMISVDRVIGKEAREKDYFKCQDILYLPDHKIIRIQLIARIYLQLCLGFESRLHGRDDKAIVALIYLTDFLFKFHGRAFSWENLELLDELAHMHRAHDIRGLIYELVDHYSDRYLHRIINGMYAYRFRSYLTKELEYMSSHSEEEMAAFNFTLDESQTLRANYISLLETDEHKNNTDIIIMLGELHECYQEYETARQYYRHCLEIWDNKFKYVVGDEVQDGIGHKAVLQSVYNNTPQGRLALTSLLQWGPARLKMLLKIGMTHELVRNYDEALMCYRQCMQLSDTMIKAFSTISPEKADYFTAQIMPVQKSMPVFKGMRLRLSHEHAQEKKSFSPILEHMDIMFEPLFAYAWLLSKYINTIDTSTQVIDSGLDRFKELLTINLGLTLNKPIFFQYSQWYKKAGALSFYFGHTLYDKIGKPYINDALTKYRESAKWLTNHANGNSPSWKEEDTFFSVLLDHPLPIDYGLSVSECLSDLSESIVAMTTLDKLFVNDTIINHSPQQLFFKIDNFFASSNHAKKCLLDHISNNFDGLSEPNKVILAIEFAFVSSFYSIRAGYIETAVRDSTHAMEMLAQFMNWFWLKRMMEPDKKYNLFFIISPLIEYITWFITNVPELMCSVNTNVNRANLSQSDPYLIGDLIPASSLATICSIATYFSLLIKHDDLNDNELNKGVLFLKFMGREIKTWINNNETLPVATGTACGVLWCKFWHKILIELLERHRYPVLNQLNGLKTLVDATLIDGIMTENPKAVIRTTAWLEELLQIEAEYNGPFHFTPQQTGLSLYLYWKAMNQPSDLGLGATQLNIKAEARRFLQKSHEMCHAGRAYYTAIDKLYYLYDDFNDNQIHRQHALQMAGNKLVVDALKELGESSEV